MDINMNNARAEKPLCYSFYYILQVENYFCYKNKFYLLLSSKQITLPPWMPVETWKYKKITHTFVNK